MNLNKELKEYINGLSDKEAIDLLKRMEEKESAMTPYVDIKTFVRKISRDNLEWFHEWWLDLQDNNPTSVILGPRGHGKTIVCGVNRAVHYALHHPNDAIGYITQGDDKARDFVEACRERLESKEVKEIYGDVKGYPWSSLRLKLSNNMAKEREANIMGFSVESKRLTSYHFNLLIVDDPVDYYSSISEIQRVKYDQWRRHTLFGVGRFKFKIMYLGTRYTPDDNWNTLIEDGEPTAITPIIFNSDTERTYKDKSNVYYPDRYYDALWPDMVPRWEDKILPGGENIMCIETRRKKQGEVFFQAQFQQNVSAMKDNIVKGHMIEWFNPDTDKINVNNMIRVLGIDPANYEEEDHRGSDPDMFGVTAIGYNQEDGKYYVFFHTASVMSANEEINLICSLIERIHPHYAFIENNSGQSYFVSWLRNQDRLVKLTGEGKTKIVGHPTRKFSKTERLRQQSVKLENHMIRFLSNDDDMDKLVKNIIGLGTGFVKHDDPADSWMIALEGIDRLGNLETTQQAGLM